MDQEPEFYVSPEDLEAQMNAEERGEDNSIYFNLHSLKLLFFNVCIHVCACVLFHR